MIQAHGGTRYLQLALGYRDRSLVHECAPSYERAHLQVVRFRRPLLGSRPAWQTSPRRPCQVAKEDMGTISG